LTVAELSDELVVLNCVSTSCLYHFYEDRRK
jgi:hypothetical protein